MKAVSVVVAVALFACITFWLRVVHHPTPYYELTPYKPGNNFTLHVVKVTENEVEATGHGVRLLFKCFGRSCEHRLAITDYVACESTDGLNLLIYRETTQKMGESETRVYELISEEAAER